jgi:hypothetical protein
VTSNIVATPFPPDPRPRTVPAVKLEKEYAILASDGRLVLVGQAYNLSDADAVLKAFRATASQFSS